MYASNDPSEDMLNAGKLLNNVIKKSEAIFKSSEDIVEPSEVDVESSNVIKPSKVVFEPSIATVQQSLRQRKAFKLFEERKYFIWITLMNHEDDLSRRIMVSINTVYNYYFY